MFLAEDGRPIGLTWNYTRRELMADAAVHIAGIAFGVAGSIAIVILAAMAPLDWTERAAVAVYAAALVSMLGVSATYNMWPVGRRKWILRRADHALIYLMIAGTYTPLVALVGRGSTAWMLARLHLGPGGNRHRPEASHARPFRPGRHRPLSPPRMERRRHLRIGDRRTEPRGALASGNRRRALLGRRHLPTSGAACRTKNAIWHAFVLAATACHYGTVLTSVMSAAP